MKLGIKGTAYVVLVCAAMACVSHTRAADTTNYLGSLRGEISFRATNSPATNKTQKAQLAALKAAGNKLQKPAKTYSGQLGQLATAATILGTRFTNDTQLDTLENNSIASYSDAFAAQWDEAMTRIGTNRLQRGLSNQLVKAQAAYTNAVNNTNGVASQARALAQAFNKLRIPFAQVVRKYEMPGGGGGGGGGGPFQAPDSVELPDVIVMIETAPSPSETTTLFFHTMSDTRAPYKWYETHHPTELGTWTYQKLSDKTAVLNCTVSLVEDAGAISDPHTYSLTFTSATTGTFTGRNSLNENMTGTFSIQQE
jgi:hypothetical protein